jgi:zinc protease
MMTRSIQTAIAWFLALPLTTAAFGSEPAPSQPPSYAVISSTDTYDDPSWKKVVEALVAKHEAHRIVYRDSVDEVLEELAERHPRYTCFVARPSEATRSFVTEVHTLTRGLDEDPYIDTLWGILTGYDAACALRIARTADPLTVRKVAAGTELAMEMVEEGLWYCELKKNRMVRKLPGGKAAEQEGPDDTTRALVDALNEYHADLFVTSGHATERDWQIGFAYRNGSFRSKAGKLFGRDTQGREYAIDSPNPKVYLPIGNCLMGHIDGPDAMALAWMNRAGVRQMMGYTVPTWFGYAGWGCLDYFVEQPGRYTLAEAFFANHHALVHCLENGIGNARGLQFDRDVVAFYGDPAWAARMADRPRAYEQQLTEENGLYNFLFRGNRGADSFKPVNTNGSQRGWRPIVEILPFRLTAIEMVDDGGLAPLVADDFILVPNPRDCDPNREYRIQFRAERAEG